MMLQYISLTHLTCI